MIPKTVHYVWLGSHQIPQPYAEYIDNWHKVLPDYKFVRWDESNCDYLSTDYARQAYQAGKFGFVSDVVRVQVLYEYGGIYLDTDVEVLRGFDDLLGEQMFIGMENNAYVQSAVIASEAHHPFWRQVIDFYAQQQFTVKGKQNLTPNTIYLTYFLQKWGGNFVRLKDSKQVLRNGDSTITVLPRSWLAPIDYTTGESIADDNTRTIHRFAGTWTNTAAHKRDKFLCCVRRLVGKKVFSGLTRAYVNGCCRQLRHRLSRNKHNLRKI